MVQGIDLEAGGRNKTKHRTAPKSDNVYLKLLVKVGTCGRATGKGSVSHHASSWRGALGRGVSCWGVEQTAQAAGTALHCIVQASWTLGQQHLPSLHHRT